MYNSTIARERKKQQKLLINIIYDTAFKSGKRFEHYDIIGQVILGMRSKVSK